MRNQFIFSKRYYLKYSWYKYILLWIGISLLIWALIFFNGKLSLLSGMISSLAVLLVTILLLINRIRTWRKSKVEVSNHGIVFTKVKADGFEASVELGRRKKIATYSAFPVQRSCVVNNNIHVYGDVICVEETYANSVMNKKEKHLNHFVIPPYFRDLQIIADQLKHLNGGSGHER